MMFRMIRIALIFLFSISGLAAFGQSKPSSDLTGKWAISWEARIGTEHDAIQLKQTDSRLSGTFIGKLGHPNVSGTVEGKNITLILDFPGSQPYTLVFTGTTDGDKMEGKFEIKNVIGGYDWHGENVRPSNYSWNAVRQADDQKSGSAAIQTSSAAK